MQSSGISSAETGAIPPSRFPSTPTRKRFALTGRSHEFDPRIDAARGDLADLRLADRIFAPHYAAAVPRSAVRRSPVLDAPRGETVSELLQGEDFEVLELSAGHAWGVSAVDGVVGFVAIEALGAPVAPTHVICAREADGLPMGTRIIGGTLDRHRIRPLDAPIADFVAVAESLIGVPAAPGGRSGAGVDAAGLIFLSLSLAGVRAPRFLDLQAARLGHMVSAEAPVLRGDLFYAQHAAAIAVDATDAIHVAGDTVTRALIASIFDAGSDPVRRRLP